PQGKIKVKAKLPAQEARRRQTPTGKKTSEREKTRKGRVDKAPKRAGAVASQSSARDVQRAFDRMIAKKVEEECRAKAKSQTGYESKLDQGQSNS
ncbi:hypothetical protein BOX15_Mlig020716g2, partial [Macrostomum lignano]